MHVVLPACCVVCSLYLTPISVARGYTASCLSVRAPDLTFFSEPVASSPPLIVCIRHTRRESARLCCCCVSASVRLSNVLICLYHRQESVFQSCFQGVWCCMWWGEVLYWRGILRAPAVWVRFFVWMMSARSIDRSGFVLLSQRSTVVPLMCAFVLCSLGLRVRAICVAAAVFLVAGSPFCRCLACVGVLYSYALLAALQLYVCVLAVPSRAVGEIVHPSRAWGMLGHIS